MAKTYAHPSNARRAARAALGPQAKEGEHYRLDTLNTGIAWTPIVKPKPAAKRKAVKRRPKKPAGARATGRSRKAAAGVGGSMTAALVAFLTDPIRDGATAAEVAARFGWEEHTARARISTGPRTMGYKAVRTREEGRGSVYRLESQLALGEERAALGNRYSAKKARKARK